MRRIVIRPSVFNMSNFAINCNELLVSILWCIRLFQMQMKVAAVLTNVMSQDYCTFCTVQALLLSYFKQNADTMECLVVLFSLHCSAKLFWAGLLRYCNTLQCRVTAWQLCRSLGALLNCTIYAVQCAVYCFGNVNVKSCYDKSKCCIRSIALLQQTNSVPCSECSASKLSTLTLLPSAMGTKFCSKWGPNWDKILSDMGT